jgi:hypothetical protein
MLLAYFIKTRFCVSFMKHDLFKERKQDKWNERLIWHISIQSISCIVILNDIKEGIIIT